MDNFKKIILIYFSIIFVIIIFSNRLYSNSEKNYKKIAIILWRGMTPSENGFMQYFQKKNLPVKFIIKSADENITKLEKIVKEIKEEKFDLIYTFGTTVTLAITGKYDDSNNIGIIKNTPLIFSIVSNPVSAKIVRDNVMKNRNITGVSHLVPFYKQLVAMKKFMKFKKIGIYYNPLEENSRLAVSFFKRVARKENYKLILVKNPVDTNNKPTHNIEKMVNQLVSKKPDIIYIPSDSFIISNISKIMNIINRHNIPTFSATEKPIRMDNGVLAGLVSPYYSCGTLAAFKAEKILFHNKSAKSIPIELLPKFSYLINMKTSLKIKKYPSLDIIKIADIIKKDK